MATTSRDTLLTLDVGFAGAPHCEVGAKTGLSFDGLDWGFIGAPFVSCAAEGPTGFNARVKVGSFGQIMAGQVKIGGTWKAIAAMKVKVGESWRTI